MIYSWDYGEQMQKFDYWCQKVLPLVYDDSLSYYEQLCKIVEYLNEVIDVVNGIPDYIRSLVTDEQLMLFLSELLDELRKQIASANEGTSETATADRETGELVWLNGLLYRVSRPMGAGDKYFEGSNCEKTTIEELIKNVYYVDEETLSIRGIIKGTPSVITEGDYHIYNSEIKAIQIVKESED